jgi:NAD(P)H-hydrate epimerase
MGWKIEVRAAYPEAQWAELTKRQSEKLELRTVYNRSNLRPLIVLDGLLGIGAAGALREPILAACVEINRLRTQENAQVFALDIPTGLDGDTGAAADEAVRADFTLTIGCAKLGLVADQAINYVGRLAVLPLSELSSRLDPASAAGSQVATAASLKGLLLRRDFDTHKGMAGRVGIYAGSTGAVGAAVMCAAGAVRGGAGLVTLHVPSEIYSVVATRTRSVPASVSNTDKQCSK